MKLKTLKDLVFNYIPKVEGGSINIITEARIKEEAIKWVKDCSHCKFVKYKQQDNDKPMKELTARDFCLSCLKWMKFFNITEEDLS